MNTYLVKLELQSAIISPIQADTLFGHLCWGILYGYGEKKLIDFLTSYQKGTPPLILSDGFIEGFLPKPKLIHNLQFSEDFETYQKIKVFNKIQFIPSSLMINENGFSMTENDLFDHWLINSKSFIAHLPQPQNLIRNTINRYTNTTEEDGGLYSITHYYPVVEKKSINDKNSSKLFNIYDLYVYTSEYSDKEIKDLIDFALMNGYGADKSVGKGVLKIKSIEPLKLPNEGNRYMSLSSFVPNGVKELKDLKADIFTKFGKLGGHFASTINPFKKPIIMFKTGACFTAKKLNYVGSILRNVHNDSRIVHYAFAPVIPYYEAETHEIQD